MELGRLGIWAWQFRQADLEGAPEALAELEELGFGTLWIPGGIGGDVLGDVGRALDDTSRMVVATGVVNIWMHQADDIAAGHARLEAAHPGRVLLGLGVSHGPLIDRNGPRYGRPLAVMDAFLDGLDSASPPVPVAERVLAALGPKMLERARDRAAGAHPYLTTPDHTAGARAILGPDRLLAPEIMVVVDDDPTRARAIARQTLSGYLPRLPNYANNLRRSGFGDDDLAEGLSDRLVDALVPAGLEAIAGRVREHLDAGADHVCLQVLTQRPTELPRTEWRALGQLVAEFG